MTNSALKLLCIGHDTTLLQTRSAVLRIHGYAADGVLFNEFDGKLATADYDLIVLSKSITPEECAAIMALKPRSTKLISLKAFAAPSKLSGLVEHELASRGVHPAS